MEGEGGGGEGGGGEGGGEGGGGEGGGEGGGDEGGGEGEMLGGLGGDGCLRQLTPAGLASTSALRPPCSLYFLTGSPTKLPLASSS